ncbi:MAG: hypothetical protein MJE77_19050 [Proteobacteria bacterium]|nr:hypothetical protein [Pseudomonadota bacterium]
MSAPKNKGYRRSWKNLLLNKRYQLSFTLFMVGLGAVLMVLLGYCVVREAQEASAVRENLILPCPEVPEVVPLKGGRILLNAPGQPGTEIERADTSSDRSARDPAVVGEQVTGGPTLPLGDRSAAPALPDPTGSRRADDPQSAPDRPSQHIVVEVGSMKLHDDMSDQAEMVATLPPDLVDAIAERTLCHVEQMGQMAELEAGYQRILIVLITSGVLLLFGLLFYGIKMTHRVAGPLYKVTLYFDKMKRGVYSEVYNLRRGDQLVEFYDHFKSAHGGLVSMQREDIEHLRQILDLAEKEDLASRSPEIAAALQEMRTILARKEKSVE